MVRLFQKLNFHGQNSIAVQTCSGSRYWLTNNSIMSSVYSTIHASHSPRVTGSFANKSEQICLKLSPRAASLAGSVIKLVIACTKILQVVQLTSFFGSLPDKPLLGLAEDVTISRAMKKALKNL